MSRVLVASSRCHYVLLATIIGPGGRGVGKRIERLIGEKDLSTKYLIIFGASMGPNLTPATTHPLDRHRSGPARRRVDHSDN